MPEALLGNLKRKSRSKLREGCSVREIFRQHEWDMTKRYSANLDNGEKLVFLPGIKKGKDIINTPGFDGVIYKDGEAIATYSAKKCPTPAKLLKMVEEAIHNADNFVDLNAWSTLPDRIASKNGQAGREILDYKKDSWNKLFQIATPIMGFKKGVAQLQLPHPRGRRAIAAIFLKDFRFMADIQKELRRTEEDPSQSSSQFREKNPGP